MLLLNILLWFVLINVASAMPPKDVEKIRRKNEMNRMKSLHMGFLHPPLEKKFNSYRSSIVVEKIRIKHIHKQLQCSYALFGVRYMRLIEGLLADPIFLVRGDFKKVLFDEEAAAMLAATINITELKWAKNILWTFWLYADRLHRFFENIAILNVINDQYHSAIVTVHQSVYAVLERFLKAYDCSPYDVENKLTLLNYEIIQLANKTDKSQSLVALIENNKSEFEHQKLINSNLGILTIGEQKLSMETLTLNGLLGIQSIVDQSLGTDFWDTVKYGLIHEYNTAMGLGMALSNQANALYVFQKQYIDTIKLIALHLGRHFLMATTNAGRLGNDSLQERKEKVIAELTNLIQLLVNVIRERTDDTIHIIICCIETCTIDSDGVPRNAGVEEIENKITYLLSESKITAHDLSKFSSENYNRRPVDSDEFHASIVEQFNSFVKNAVQVLSEVNFTIVNSFIAYTFSEEYRHVAAIENEKNI